MACYGLVISMFIFTTVRADLRSLPNLIQKQIQLTEEKFKNLNSLDSGSDEEHSLPKFGFRTIFKSDMSLINEYGCWCYFQNDHGKGHGKTVDNIDKLCQTLHHGYTCAMEDSRRQDLLANDATDPCIPWEVPYNFHIGGNLISDMNLERINMICDAQNDPDTCGNWACKVETYFVHEMINYLTHQGSSLPDLFGEVGIFWCETTAKDFTTQK